MPDPQSILAGRHSERSSSQSIPIGLTFFSMSVAAGLGCFWLKGHLALFTDLGVSPLLGSLVMFLLLLVSGITANLAYCRIEPYIGANPTANVLVRQAAEEYNEVEAFLAQWYPQGGHVERRDAKRISEFVLRRMAHKRAAPQAGDASVETVRAIEPFVPALQPQVKKAEFDYQGAYRGELYYSRNAGNDLREVSVGRPDWMPISVLMLLASRSQRGEQLLLQAFEREFNLSLPYYGAVAVGHAAQLKVWLHDTYIQLEVPWSRLATLDKEREQAEPEEDGEQDGYAGFTSFEAFDAFKNSWEYTHIHPVEQWLASSDRRTAYYRIPEVKRHLESVEDLRIWMMKWAADWLASSGFVVDVENQMVLAVGYTPLCLTTPIQAQE